MAKRHKEWGNEFVKSWEKLNNNEASTDLAELARRIDRRARLHDRYSGAFVQVRRVLHMARQVVREIVGIK